MPPRITLAWSRCPICGRHAPVWHCRAGGRVVEACMFCAYTLGLSCEGLRVPSRPYGVRGRPSLEPDESLLEELSTGRTRAGGAQAKRRVASRRGRRSRGSGRR
ncbi:MAG: hypothetical protein GSR80_000303 [Desulfurococcales archaeon]|nr:hypothetical protein [Desulfurococcales archaeon]